MTKIIERPGMLLPEMDDATRREFLIGAAGILLLPAGCGSGGESGDEPSGETRAVKHFMGETEVPVKPERVVVLDDSALETALSVGVEPVGAPSPTTLGYLGERISDGTDGIGENYAPNLERIAALEPDVIVGNEYSAEEVYDQLSRIAPTVVAESGDAGDRWKEVHSKTAEAMGAEKAGERVMDEYHARIDEFKEAMGDPEEMEVSVVRISTEFFRVDHKDLFNGAILEDVGLSRPPSQDKAGEGGSTELSLERLDLAEGDVMFVYAFSEEDQALLSELKEDPLWNRLDVVRRGEVYEVGEHWLYTGPISANLVLDDLEKRLLREGG